MNHTMTNTLLLVSLVASLVVQPANAQILFEIPVNFDGETSPGLDRDMAVGDLDGDGDLDLAFAWTTFNGRWGVKLNDGAGVLMPGESYQVGGRNDPAWGVALGDLDADGDLDAAVAHGNVVNVFLNNGDATFFFHETINSVFDAISPAIGDMDGDGDLDIVVSTWNFRVHVVLNDGSGGFPDTPVPYLTPTRMRSIDLGDVDGDGDLDVAVPTSGLSILLNRGDGTLDPAETYDVSGSDKWSVRLGDFDNDGDLDAAVACHAEFGGTPGVYILPNLGDGSFGAEVRYDTGSQPMGLTAADFDSDGDLDLAVADNYLGIGMANNLGLSRLTILVNDANGGFGDQLRFQVGPNGATAGGPWSVVTGDFDDDGDTDILTRNKTGWDTAYTISLLRNVTETGSLPALLISVDVVNGMLLDGDLPQLLASDDDYLHTRSGFGQTVVDLHNMEMIVNAITTVDSSSTIDLTIESRLDEPAGLAQIRLRNWNTNQFESVGSYSIGNTDQIDTLNNINALSYVDGSGNIDLSIKHMVFVPFFAFTFESFVDQVEITIQ